MFPPKVTPPDSAREGASRFARAIDVLRSAVAERAFPGASFGVYARGQILALEGVGRFTYEPDAPAVTPSTVYDLASLTKVIATTSAAMLLYERGILKFQARVGDILPGFVVGMAPGSGKEKVSLGMLLAHTSGLPGYARLFEQHPTPEGMLRAALRLSLSAAPGTRTEYSDIGFILLGKAIEVLSGDYLARYCHRNIFSPLALHSLRFCPPETWKAFIPPTEIDNSFRHRTIQGEVQDENCAAMGGLAGHAGLFGNASDILRFAQTYLRKGRRQDDAKPLFRDETMHLFTARQPEPAGTTRALGWDTPSRPESSSGKYFGERAFGHLGYAGTSLWIDPERDLAVVLLTNRTWPDRASQLIQQVRPAFHDAVVEAL
jgi:CubicO group peptidase (beta-lactamase class C family)